MRFSADDIDDLSISGSRVILAIGSKRYLFDKLDTSFVDRLKQDYLNGRLAQSSAAGALLRRIGDPADAGDRPKQSVGLCISAGTVTRISSTLRPLTGGGLALLLAASGATCLAVALGWAGDSVGIGANLQRLGPLDIAVALLVYVASIFVHEFGHAARCYRETGLVGSIRVRLSRGLPVFTTDVSSVHLATPTGRAKIAVAGVIFQSVLAGHLLMVPVPGIQLGAMLALLAALFSLLPYPGSDGFWFMNDLLGIDLPRTFRDASLGARIRHPYTIWLLATNFAICGLLLRFGYLGLVEMLSRGDSGLAVVGLWAGYIAYSFLLVSSHAIRTIGFVRRGKLGRWDMRDKAPPDAGLATST